MSPLLIATARVCACVHINIGGLLLTGCLASLTCWRPVGYAYRPSECPEHIDTLQWSFDCGYIFYGACRKLPTRF